MFVDGSGNHWDRQVTGSTLSVLQCGAKPDNMTDNTTAFQSGVNWLISAFGGGTLALPASFTPGTSGAPNCYVTKSEVMLPPLPSSFFPTMGGFPVTGGSNTRIVTLTFPGSYLFPVGSSITISDVTPSGFNGMYPVVASTQGVSTSTVSYVNAATGYSSGGMVTNTSGTSSSTLAAGSGATATITFSGTYLAPVGSLITVSGFTGGASGYNMANAVVTNSTIGASTSTVSSG